MTRPIDTPVEPFVGDGLVYNPASLDHDLRLAERIVRDYAAIRRERKVGNAVWQELWARHATQPVQDNRSFLEGVLTRFGEEADGQGWSEIDSVVSHVINTLDEERFVVDYQRQGWLSHIGYGIRREADQTGVLYRLSREESPGIKAVRLGVNSTRCQFYLDLGGLETIPSLSVRSVPYEDFGCNWEEREMHVPLQAVHGLIDIKIENNFFDWGNTLHVLYGGKWQEVRVR